MCSVPVPFCCPATEKNWNLCVLYVEWQLKGTGTDMFNGKPEAATAVIVAPDNRHEHARNILSSK